MSKEIVQRVYLSPPHVGKEERELLLSAFDSNWIAPVGPELDAFEEEFAQKVGAKHAVAVSSGTAALHLALRLLGVSTGDEVLVSTFTFCASVNPILYQGGVPVFIDSESSSWNMDPNLLEAALKSRAAIGRMPKAVVLVHLYGQMANMGPIIELCKRYGVPLVEDAAEALGATWQGRPPGGLGDFGVFSFNGNKIITTSGGGMLTTADWDLARRAKHLSTQAREAARHYQHSEVGYNYRMSNLLAAIGRGQLRTLPEKVAARRAHFAYYESRLGELPEVGFMPEAAWGESTRWLSCITVDPTVSRVTPEQVCARLEENRIEARPVWKPMHLQPVYSDYQVFGGAISETLFDGGMCLPSGSDMTPEVRKRVADAVCDAIGRGE
ncbi:MAG: dTDP-4-amino-4,6-dideoxygalactose transaminase [Rhodothermales bacterium]|jgi:dTDP-4-amino-4,6-dideoxygalactose transaminase